jgi:hypothetical protein
MSENRDEWSLAVSQAKGPRERGVFRKNLTPKVCVGHPEYGFIAYLTFAYVPEDGRGFPSSEDADTLLEIEQVGFRELESNGLAIHVATATKGGIKDFLFYTRDPDQFLTRAEKFRESNPEFQVGCEIAPDPEWKHYEDFPGDQEQHNNTV